MKKFFRKIKLRLASNMNIYVFDGLLLMVILLLINSVVVVNIFRVIGNGRTNYETYLKEKESFEEIQKKNEELQREYEYVTTDDFKKLLLRESSNLAEGQQKLYRTKERPVYYNEEIELLDLKDKGNYFDWWIKLIN